ncbi:hypothetical protein IWZ03DRAFT_80760 [Phyllosticta citriasiana]|uniref:Uncharacterized protein n=1 Tax=Phyllosticta citriasiana TaxID=595635 RepID=A0ABR1K9S9_9PEZI
MYGSGSGPMICSRSRAVDANTSQSTAGPPNHREKRNEEREKNKIKKRIRKKEALQPGPARRCVLSLLNPVADSRASRSFNLAASRPSLGDRASRPQGHCCPPRLFQPAAPGSTTTPARIAPLASSANHQAAARGRKPCLPRHRNDPNSRPPQPSSVHMSRCRYCLAAAAAAMSNPRRKEDCMPTKPAAALEHPSSDYANQTLRQPWPRVASRPIKTRSSAGLRAKADRHLHCSGWTAQASLLVHQPTGLVSERPQGFEGDGELPAIRTAIVSQSE